MLLSPFIGIAEKTITGLLFALACSAAVLYFGQPEIFDPIIAVVVLLLAVTFRKDKNLLSLLAIIGGLKIIEEVTWLLFDNTLQIKIPLYIFMLAILPFVSSGWLRLYLFGFVGSAAAAEIYWYWTDYPAPWIYWQVWMCMIVAVARRAASVRVSWMIDLTGGKGIDFLKLDDHLFNLFTVLIFYYSLITFEYYLRHFLGLKDITYLYYASDYIGGVFSSFVVYVMIVESIKQINRAKLNA